MRLIALIEKMFSGNYLPGIIYLLFMAVFFTWIIVIASSSLKNVRNRRKKRLQSRKSGFSIPLDTSDINGLKKMKKTGMESIETQFSISRKIIIPSIVIIGLIISLIPFLSHVPATLLSFIVGAFTVVTGITARPFLENLFAGIVLSSSRSLNIGDTVIVDNNYGTVEDISLTYTSIKTWDWKRYIVPNINMLSKDFLNLSLIEKNQWAYIEYWVSYSNDLDLVKELSIKCAEKSSYNNEDHDVEFWIMDMDKDSVKCWLAVWADSPAEAWGFKNDLRTNLITEFRKEGIEIQSFSNKIKIENPDSSIYNDVFETPEKKEKNNR